MKNARASLGIWLRRRMMVEVGCADLALLATLGSHSRAMTGWFEPSLVTTYIHTKSNVLVARQDFYQDRLRPAVWQSRAIQIDRAHGAAGLVLNYDLVGSIFRRLDMSLMNHIQRLAVIRPFMVRVTQRVEPSDAQAVNEVAVAVKEACVDFPDRGSLHFEVIGLAPIILKSVFPQVTIDGSQGTKEIADRCYPGLVFAAVVGRVCVGH